MTTMCYKALILQGEIWCWSLSGLKGLSKEKINEKYAGEDLNFIELALYISLDPCGNEFTATLSSLKNVT